MGHTIFYGWMYSIQCRGMPTEWIGRSYGRPCLVVRLAKILYNMEDMSMQNKWSVLGEGRVMYGGISW